MSENSNKQQKRPMFSTHYKVFFVVVVLSLLAAFLL